MTKGFTLHFTCQACGKTKIGNNIELHAHHIISFSSLLQCDREHLFDKDLGITLCSECHFSSKPSSLHNLYGTNDVSPEELEEFVNSVRRKVGLKESFSVEEYVGGKVLLPLRNSNPQKSRKNPNSITSRCKEYGISRTTFAARIRRGWSEEDALKNPVQKKQNKM